LQEDSATLKRTSGTDHSLAAPDREAPCAGVLVLLACAGKGACRTSGAWATRAGTGAPAGRRRHQNSAGTRAHGRAVPEQYRGLFFAKE